MKNRLALASLLIGLLAFTTSCSDDDDNNPVEDIVNEVIDEGEEIIEDGEEIIDGGDDEARTTVVINEVGYLGTDWIEIHNPTSEAVDVSEYWLCLGAGTYRQFTNEELTIEGNTLLGSGEFLVITGYNLPDESAGLGLYTTNEGGFVDPEVLIDYVQYGAEGSQREPIADEAGLWEAGTFIPAVTAEGSTIIYSGTGNGVDSWSESTEPTQGAAN